MPINKVCGQMGIHHLSGPRLAGRHAWVYLELCVVGQVDPVIMTKCMVQQRSREVVWLMRCGERQNRRSEDSEE